MVVKVHCKCLKCKVKGKPYEWDSRVQFPAMCPNCHSPTWDEPSKIHSRRKSTRIQSKRG